MRMKSLPLRSSLVVATLLTSTLAFGSRAHADAGFVELTAGGRVAGDIIAVYVGEHVTVRLADGSTVNVSWTETLRVQDGSMVYERDGSYHRAATLAPAETTTPAQAVTPTPAPTTGGPIAVMPTSGTSALGGGSMMSRADVMRLVIKIDDLPSRGGSVGMLVFGSLFLANGVSLMAGGGVAECEEDYYDEEGGTCGFRLGLIMGGLISSALGLTMTIRGAGRLRTRGRVRRELLASEGLLAEAPRLRLDAHVDRGTFVPSLALSF